MGDSVFYFVDESGDLARFDKRGQSLLDKQGVSKVFILGVAQFYEDLDEVRKNFEELRADLSLDPCLRDIPSLKKSLVAFHAKDDCAAVRREVFKLIKHLKLKVLAVVRRKDSLIEQSENHFNLSGQKITEQMIYEELVSKLFKSQLHRNRKIQITFSSRGSTFSNDSLSDALERSKSLAYSSWGVKADSEILIYNKQPSDSIGLQIIDYLLWSLFQVFNRHDDKYFQLVKNKFSLILDLDDKRISEYGTHYDKTMPLDLNKIL